MKQLPDEQTMLSILEEARDFEQAARAMCEMSTEIAYKSQKRVSELKQAAQKEISESLAPTQSQES